MLLAAGLVALAKTGTVETTLSTSFYDITSKIENKHGYKNVFLVDQPGIGGLHVTEADYLADFGPGKAIILEFEIQFYSLFYMIRSFRFDSHAWR